MLENFSQWVFTLLVAFGGQHAGNSPYSFELVRDCGVDRNEPLCQIQPSCAVKAWRCSPPRWSRARGGWVRPESKAAALHRYRKIADAIARQAFWQSRCRDGWGVVSEQCTPSGWPEGPRSLALVAATTALWESGLREDIQFGHAPMGRGPAGEACIMQVMPNQIRSFADWIPEVELAEYDSLPHGPERQNWDDRWASEMLGDSAEALDRCVGTGMRMLARARAACFRRPGRSWPHKMWSMYGTGRTCNAAGVANDFASKRAATYWRMRSYRSEASNDPAWKVPEPKSP